jgi:glycosyltransferase involved in cell wall biosynthesis
VTPHQHRLRSVHAVLPDGVDDPRRPSGGNVYDRRVLDGLVDLGWEVHEHLVPTPWPRVDPSARGLLESVLGDCPDGALVLVDGLVVSAGPDVVAAAGARLRLVVLSHMPLGYADPAAAPGERAAMAHASGVVATSRWTRDWLAAQHGVPAERMHVAVPGVEPAATAPGTGRGGGLLCVAAVTPGKGHDVLLAALRGVADLPWRCTCVGALDVDPGFAVRLRRALDESGLSDRLTFTGPLTAEALDREYAGADVVVLPSRAETYGMVLAEALAHGLPVVTTDVGGVAEALGPGGDEDRPGLLVPVGDAGALADALRAWLSEPALRERLRRSAALRRGSLSGWPDAARAVSDALSAVLSEPPRRPIRMGR